MLGLGNTITNNSFVGGLTTITGFDIFQASDLNDDENVKLYMQFTDPALINLTLINGANDTANDQVNGTWTLEVSRLDASDNPVGGATSSGTVYAYRYDSIIGSTGKILLSDDNSSSIAIENWDPEGSALIDLSTFGGVDITGSDTSSNYKFSITVTASGYTSHTEVLQPVALDKPV